MSVSELVSYHQGYSEGHGVDPLQQRPPVEVLEVQKRYQREKEETMKQLTELAIEADWDKYAQPYYGE